MAAEPLEMVVATTVVARARSLSGMCNYQTDLLRLIKKY